MLLSREFRVYSVTAARCRQSVYYVPVSYTHLDVYKRQTEDHGADSPGRRRS